MSSILPAKVFNKIGAIAASAIQPFFPLQAFFISLNGFTSLKTFCLLNAFCAFRNALGSTFIACLLLYVEIISLAPKTPKTPSKIGTAFLESSAASASSTDSISPRAKSATCFFKVAFSLIANCANSGEIFASFCTSSSLKFTKSKLCPL